MPPTNTTVSRFIPFLAPPLRRVVDVVHLVSAASAVFVSWVAAYLPDQACSGAESVYTDAGASTLQSASAASQSRQRVRPIDPTFATCARHVGRRRNAEYAQSCVEDARFRDVAYDILVWTCSYPEVGPAAVGT